MGVDPADPGSLDAAMAHECDDGGVKDDGGVMHLFVAGEQGLAPANVVDEQLAMDKVLTADFGAAQQLP